MQKVLVLFTVLAVCFFQIAHPAFAQTKHSTKNKFPSEVWAEIERMNEGCTDETKKIKQTDIEAKAVKIADLNGDGYSDYIIDDNYLPVLDDFVSCRHGARGDKGVVILAGAANGHFTNAFEGTVWDFKIHKAGKHSKAWVTGGSGFCGQTGNHSFADAIMCERELVWMPNEGKFDFAPLSEAHFLKN